MDMLDLSRPLLRQRQKVYLRRPIQKLKSFATSWLHQGSGRFMRVPEDAVRGAAGANQQAAQEKKD